MTRTILNSGFISMGSLPIILIALLIGAKAESSTPPSPLQYALMARYIIHNSDWISIATISIQENLKGYPFVSLESVSDGAVENSTGVPYLYMTDINTAAKDLLQNNSTTIMASLAQSNYCIESNYDPQDPRCAKVMISGKFVKINNTDYEYNFGQDVLFARHPVMKTWPKAHAFYVAKIVPEQISVLDFFGGQKNVKIEDYFNANLTSLVNLDSFEEISVIQVEN